MCNMWIIPKNNFIPIILMIHSAAGTAALLWAHFRSWNLFAINTAPAS